MNRDLVVKKISDNNFLVIATDCSGACGNKELDYVNVTTETLAYFAARVAFMEVLSVGATPLAYTVSNLIKDGYDDLHKGINKLLDELQLENIENITSTETNFDMLQSAIGITVIGQLSKQINDNIKGLEYACIGHPLVGDEVVNMQEDMLGMKDFISIIEDDQIPLVLPIGSKGIKRKMQITLNVTPSSTEVDINKSAGPSTCVVIGFKKNRRDELAEKFGKLFSPISIA